MQLYILFFLLPVALTFNATEEPVSMKPTGDNSDDGDGPPSFANFTRKMSKWVMKPAGNTVALKCKASGKQPMNLTWYKDEKTPPKRNFGEYRYTHWQLVMEDAVTSDTGNYTCMVCNIYGCVNHTYKVEVVERFRSKPYIEKGYPQNLTVLVNTTAVLKCPQIIADTEPFLQWVRPENISDLSIDNSTMSSRPKGQVLKVLNLGEGSTW